ncbi:MAG: methionine--tRNA ligase [Aigarchaeota archaeon]|nr:methionine--tRNA ligase [Candidatus Pelearchaeum maunauluense]
MTAALPYSYAPRHFGHLAGAYLPADVFARYNRIRGNDTLFVCGTDENASSIVLEALRRGLTPQQLCDLTYPQQKETFEKLGISFDIFSRTSKLIHYKTVEEFYRRLWEKGYIYPKEIKQWYCPVDKKVLPDRFVKGSCPVCGAPEQYGDVCEVCGSFYEAFELRDPKCSICGAKPEIVEKTHFFLKLSALTEKVLEYVRPKTYWRKSTYNKTISWLEREGLRDKDITRDYDWGPPAPFPGAEGQVLYNWVENLLGYVSATRDWAEERGEPDAWRRYWLDKETKLYCFIGKDNLFFHTILFPAILIAHGDYILPYNVVVNEFVNLEGQKISTSRGWAVWLHEMLKYFDPDLIRFYALVTAPEGKDTDFRWRDFQLRVNSELIGTLANFIHRVLSFTWNMFGGVVPEADDERDAEVVGGWIGEAAQRVEQHLERCEFRDGMKTVLDLAQQGNRFLNEKEPWRNKENAPSTIFYALRIVNALSVLSYPFLPFTAERTREYLNLPSPPKWSDIYADIRPGHRIREPKPLFRKLSNEEIEARISELKATLKT